MFANSGTTFVTCLKGKALLQEPNIRQVWRDFRPHISLSDFDFEQYYTATLSLFGEYVQTLPATRHVFYAHPMGLFQLGLDRAILSTKLALKAFLEFDEKTPEQLTAYDQAELFAVFSAALLSDLGFLVPRFEVTLRDHTETLRSYDPYQGSLLAQGAAFGFFFRNPELQDWPAPGSLVLATRLLSQTQKDYRDSGFAWISRHHEILQLFYAMLLELTPAQEGTVRQRYLTSLIPTTESDLLQDLLLNIHHQGLLLPSKQQRTLFSPQNPDAEFSEEMSYTTLDPTYEARHSYEKVFGGTGSADATNTQALGSLGAALAPQIRYGLAFLGWMMALARSGKFFAGSSTLIFGLGANQVVFDLAKIQALFSQETGFPKIPPQELLSALKEIQVLKTNQVSLKSFELKTTGGEKTLFEGLVLSKHFVFGELPGPKTAINLTEVLNSKATQTKRVLRTALMTSKNLFQNKPG